MNDHATLQKACTECGKLFFPHSYNQSYCDDLCRQRAYRSRSKSRRSKKELPLSDYFNTYFAMVLQDVTPSTAQALWEGCRKDPKRRYAVINWSDIPNTTIPFDIDITPELKDDLCYHNVQHTKSDALLKYLAENPTQLQTQRPLVEVIECNPAEYLKKYG